MAEKGSSTRVGKLLRGLKKQYLHIFLTILFFSLGNILFVVPNKIMLGGVTGLSQMGFYLFKFNIGLGIFILNTPLFILTFMFYRDLFYKSVIAMMLSSLIIGLLQNPLLRFGVHNIWAGSIVGGLWIGTTLGILARMNASLGGGSMLGKMLHLRFGFPLSITVFCLDVLTIYPLSLFLIGYKETMFSFLLTFFSSLGLYLFTRKNTVSVTLKV